MSTTRRVTVTSPQTRLAHSRRRYRARWRPATLDPADAPRAVALYRAQSRRAAIALGSLFTLVFGLPLLLSALPWLDQVRLFGLPLSWLAPVAVPFPAMVWLAFWHLWRAERVEREPDHRDSHEDEPR
ncbi:hypothetical protein FHU38_003651 [Saccharomonospora amisosensis]|uniref:DUF485 domain-containing protein n=1 Tax=Saccharomonospora amisosensis TaxID=1128677 RepID=A0A7X5USC3_9PSEU|nr:hypothetical protein [Saccharomonospora amisosensis]NIJ13307.1 hypothetical protein [Saccharomonospora amisosensis]